VSPPIAQQQVAVEFGLVPEYSHFRQFAHDVEDFLNLGLTVDKGNLARVMPLLFGCGGEKPLSRIGNVFQVGQVKDQLRRIFGQCGGQLRLQICHGEVVEIVIKRERNFGMGRGFGFLKSLNGQIAQIWIGEFMS
jgi:hypothetical protein